jgi:hypothetical protein
MATYSRTCRFCGVHFLSGRIDTRFCSAAHRAQSSQRDALSRRLDETRTLLQEQADAAVSRIEALAIGDLAAAHAADRAMTAIQERAAALFTQRPRTASRAQVAA